ncbi:MAG: hypothetical protein H6631_15915 [Anaerolineaceae bacterium]|nr:hypothetical protein [Anaerolineaceae bacterium]
MAGGLTQQVKQINSAQKEQFLLTNGVVLIGIGLFFNGWTVPILFSANQNYELAEFRLRVWVFDLIFILMGFLLIRLRTKYKILLDVFVGGTVSILMLVGIEGLFYTINTYIQRGDEVVWYEGGDIYQADNNLGYKPEANTQINSIKKSNGETIYNVVYSTDDYSRRITPVQNRKDRNNYILFFGDSFTFGHGVNDNETLPFYAAQLASDYQPYNYGFSGYGPQQMLAKLQSQHLKQEIEENQGIAIYTYLDDHVSRSIGSMRVYNQWGRVMPYYTLDANNNLVRKGNFTSGRPLLSTFYIIVGKSQTARYFNVNFPAKITDSHVELAAKIIAASREAFTEEFNSDNFYVLFFPSVSGQANKIIPYLEKANINYLDYSTLYARTQSDLWIAGDAHPSAKGYKIVAAKLVEDLKLTPIE